MTPKATPIEDILTGVEKAIQSLPAEEAEEARQETVRILKNTKRPRDNLNKTIFQNNKCALFKYRVILRNLRGAADK